MSILVYGDPHGDWRPLYRACHEMRPDAVIIVGDFDCIGPADAILKPVLDAGIKVKWIPGNHDYDEPRSHDWLFEHLPGNFSGTYAQIDGMIVAGLGGIFRDKIWYPRFEMVKPQYLTRKDYLKGVKRSERFRGGLPLGMADAIFPEDIVKLTKLRADILVTHEAPTTHRNGFIAVDNLAKALHARLVVHGHHHMSYRGKLDSGVPVVGLAKAEPLLISTPTLELGDEPMPTPSYDGRRGR